QHRSVIFVYLSAYLHDLLLDALLSLRTLRARVRVVDIWDVDIRDLLDAQSGPLHADEAETSVMLHLYPALVRMDRARDAELGPDEIRRYLRVRLPAPPAVLAGVVGRPTAATAEKGARIYARILDVIGRAVFERPTDDRESDTL